MSEEKIAILRDAITRLEAEKKQLEDQSKIETANILDLKVQELQNLLNEVTALAFQVGYRFELKLENYNFSPRKVEYNGYGHWEAINFPEPDWETSSRSCW